MGGIVIIGHLDLGIDIFFYPYELFYNLGHQLCLLFVSVVVLTVSVRLNNSLSQRTSCGLCLLLLMLMHLFSLRQYYEFLVDCLYMYWFCFVLSWFAV